MRKQEIEKLYKELLSDDIESIGFNFLKNTFQKKNIPNSPSNKIPKSWKKVYFKTYPRLPQTKLEKLNPKENQLFSIIKKRKSERKFTGKDLTLKEISKILYFAAGIRNSKEMKGDLDRSKRMYPSAGARYPLEIYSVIFKGKEIIPGIYHYNVKWNTLELLLKGDFKKKFSNEITNQNWIEKSGMLIIITAVFSRTIVKYKERGWRYIFFEAGHMAQNIYLISTLLKLNCCAIGGFLDEKLIQLLDLNPKSELPLYLLAIG